MNRKYSIIKIDSNASRDEDWKAYFEARTLYANHKGDHLPFSSWKALKENNLTFIEEGVGIYLVSEETRLIGCFSFDIRLKDKVDRRYVYFRPRLIKDLDAVILKTIYSAFIEYDPLSKFLVIPSINGQYDFLEEDINAETGDYVEQFELKVSDANLEVIENWYQTYSEKFKNFDLRHFEDIPDDLLEEYCDVFLELLYDMPDESKISDFKTIINPKKIKEQQSQSRKNNTCSYRYLVFEDSKLIAKTNVSLNKKNPQRMYQYMTGVLKKYRKSGMGKWLKAAMFIKLTKDFPDLEILNTEIHAKNIASKKLSIQMGYEKTGSKKEYLISKKSIKKYLSNSL